MNITFIHLYTYFVLQVELERDQLLRSQTEVILEVQQRSGLKELLLSRRLAILSQTLETREAQLCAAVSASTADPVTGSGAAHRVEVLWFCCRAAEWYHHVPGQEVTVFFNSVLAGDPGAEAGDHRGTAAGRCSGVQGRWSGHV